MNTSLGVHKILLIDIVGSYKISYNSFEIILRNLMEFFSKYLDSNLGREDALIYIFYFS